MEELYPPEEFDILQDALNLVDRIVTQTSPGLNLDLGLPASYYSECKYDRDDEDEKIWRKSEHGGRGFYLSKGEDDDR
ncbi:hypothetical protein N7456_002386 [Penicillium angulare]|uniref:Uncharacterized protein n=1 Tax=Penicillium angulare TaxID=116970 RepID=A0A9W9KQ55_9EURO|nr:hypothetical protein N7456_002386 [Penicillium angulare]